MPLVTGMSKKFYFFKINNPDAEQRILNPLANKNIRVAFSRGMFLCLIIKVDLCTKVVYS